MKQLISYHTRQPHHPGCTLVEIEDITPRVRRWMWTGYALLLAWGVVLGLLLWCGTA